MGRIEEIDARLKSRMDAIDKRLANRMAALDARLLREIESTPNVNFSSLVPRLLPKDMTAAICGAAGVEPGRKLNVLTRAQREKLTETLKRFDIGTVTKRGYDEAVITAGGVDTSEIDPRNMRSRLVPGLSFAGEIIDADAYTGGFNLKIAWATGRAAANGIQ